VNHLEIVSHLSCLIDSPTSDVLYKITMQQVIQQIAYRMGVTSQLRSNALHDARVTNKTGCYELT
jgi:hypothetical protein